MKTKWLMGPVIAAFLGLILASVAQAQQPAQPAPQQPAQPVYEQPVQPQAVPPTYEPAPAPAPVQAKSPELIEVEAAMGRPMDREYSAFLSMTQHHPTESPPFADYLHDTYSSKQVSGIIMAGVLAPVFASVTAMGTILFYRHGLDNGGFCNHVTRDDDYNRDCKGDRGELSGIILLSTFGGILTLAMLIPGAIKISRYGKRLRRIEPLTSSSDPRSTPVIIKYAIGPEEVSLGFTF